MSARVLLSSGAEPSTPDDVLSLVRAAGHRAELTGSGRLWSVDVIT